MRSKFIAKRTMRERSAENPLGFRPGANSARKFMRSELVSGVSQPFEFAKQILAMAEGV